MTWRRRGVLAAMAGLAGCTGASDTPTPGGATPEDTATPTDAGTPTPETPYEVSIEPAGAVTFDAVPDRWMAYKMGYADVGIALGVGDRLAGLDRPGTFYEPMRELFYSQLPDVPLPSSPTNVRGNGEFDKELFYQLDADVHLVDPRLPTFYWGWDEADVREIRENVAPFFGSYARRKLPRDYEFYSLYEAFERVARVFRRTGRYGAFADLHADVQARIDERLPPADERPEVALLAGGSNPERGEFYAMDPTRGGYETKQYRDLGIGNALDDLTKGVFTRTDYEGLLEADPDTIVFHWTLQKSPAAFDSEFRQPMRDHPAGSELTAVQNDEVYRGGAAEQGPVLSLFQTELLATQQYPDRFGAFPGFGEVPDEPLFDRERVADIVNGAERT